MAKWNEILRIEELMFQARAWRPVMIWRTQARSDHPVTKTVRSVRRQSSVDRAGGVFACRSSGGKRWSAANWRARPVIWREAERPFRPLLLLSARRAWHGR
ncbi:hypothetical protein NKJ08_31775 [Mesorhizobium sp. M0244]